MVFLLYNSDSNFNFIYKAAPQSTILTDPAPILTQDEARRAELKRLKQTLVGTSFPEDSTGVMIDRAKERRRIHGYSRLEDVSAFRRERDPEVTTRICRQPQLSNACVPVSGSDPNANKLAGSVGEEMLLKLGWSNGSGLGMRRDGISEPIQAVSIKGTRGLGFTS